MNREDALIAWLRRRLRGAPGGDLVGDDAALLPAGGPWAATVDSQIAGVHYPPGLDPAAVARRLLAVNLSDLAAMGASPAYALLALAAPGGFDHRRFFRALLADCRRWGVLLAGGDLARAAIPVATLTLLGVRPEGGAWLARAGARPGHGLWVGGTLGESAAGRRLLALGARISGRRIELPTDLTSSLTGALATAARRAVRRHLAPTPQLDLGQALGRLGGASRGGVIDVSDGLAIDLARLCRESGVGAELESERLPLARGFEQLAAAIDRSPQELALGGGEDYVLLFTLAAETPPPTPSCRRIGTITAGARLSLIDRRRRRRRLSETGWDHLGR